MLKSPPPSPDPAKARAELARRFLHCYGPATPQRFAEWTEWSLADAKDAFSLIEGETVEVAVDRTTALLLARDKKAFSSPPEPRGVRLLPVQDPYLQQWDRATVLVKEGDRRRLWQPVRGPGGVLVRGEIVGTWRARTKAKRLEVSVAPFARVTRDAREGIEAEAGRLAPFRGCEAVEVRFEALCLT